MALYFIVSSRTSWFKVGIPQARAREVNPSMERLSRMNSIHGCDLCTGRFCSVLLPVFLSQQHKPLLTSAH